MVASLLVSSSSLAQCPTEAEQDAVLGSLLAELGVTPSQESPLDLVSFLSWPREESDCVVVVSVSDESHCHACAATVHVAEIKATSEGWRTTLKQPRALKMGPWGRSPKPSLMESGDRPFALKFSGGNMAFGYTSSFVSLNARVEGRYREVLALRTGASNCCTGTEESLWEWQATVEPVGCGPGFPDLRVTYSGTEIRGGAIVSAADTQELRFNGEEYRLLEPSSATAGSPPCPDATDPAR